jgi:hypothetical protein
MMASPKSRSPKVNANGYKDTTRVGSSTLRYQVRSPVESDEGGLGGRT